MSLPSTQSLIDAYFENHSVRKLHLGCGGNVLAGWLNTDLGPVRKANVMELDASATFPFADSSIHYIFSEHMIEHMSYAQGVQMLHECQRVLRPGGKIRVSTPDLRFVIELYNQERTKLQNDYLQWATDVFLPDAPCVHPAFVINNFVRDWGHQFIYDEGLLKMTMASAGFRDIRAYLLNRSDDPHLANLESEKRQPAGFLQLESFTLEGSKVSL